MRKMKFGIIIGIVTALLILMPSAATAATVTNEKLPVYMIVYNPCNNDLIELSGIMHASYQVTSDGSGGLHLAYHYNPQGLSGIGWNTGMKYQGVGVTRENRIFHAKAGVEYSLINNFHMVGQKGASYRVHENIHMTIGPDGSVKTHHDNFVIDCN